MARRIKYPAEFLLDEMDSLKAAYLAGDTRQLERRRRCYDKLRIRAQELGASNEQRKLDTPELYVQLFTDLQERAATALARVHGDFEPNLPVNDMDKINLLVPLWVEL